MIARGTIVRVKKGAIIRGFKFSGGKIPQRVAGKTYPVTVVQHYREPGKNQIHWQGRHGHWYYTSTSNVELV